MAAHEDEYIAHLKAEMEGNLYEHITARYSRLLDKMIINIDYYTVQNAEVMIIEKDSNGADKLTVTGDRLEELYNHGKFLGKYSPGQCQRIVHYVSAQEFKEKLIAQDENS